MQPLLPQRWDNPGFERCLSRNRPDSTITVSTPVAGWLQDLGLRCPADIGLANVDLRPKMIGTTGIDQNSLLVGAASVDLLVSLVRHNERGIPVVPRIVLIEGGFVSGQTTKRVAR